MDPSLSSLGEDFSFSGASSSNRILAAPPLDDASDALITNPLVPVEPWDNYDECFGSNVVEPIPIPLLGDPLASDSATLSVREGASPQSSDLASNKSDETKTAVGEVRETFFPSSACVCCWILTHYPKRRRPRSG